MEEAEEIKKVLGIGKGQKGSDDELLASKGSTPADEPMPKKNGISLFAQIGKEAHPAIQNNIFERLGEDAPRLAIASKAFFNQPGYYLDPLKRRVKKEVTQHFKDTLSHTRFLNYNSEELDRKLQDEALVFAEIQSGFEGISTIKDWLQSGILLASTSNYFFVNVYLSLESTFTHYLRKDSLFHLAFFLDYYPLQENGLQLISECLEPAIPLCSPRTIAYLIKVIYKENPKKAIEKFGRTLGHYDNQGDIPAQQKLLDALPYIRQADIRHHYQKVFKTYYKAKVRRFIHEMNRFIGSSPIPTLPTEMDVKALNPKEKRDLAIKIADFAIHEHTSVTTRANETLSESTFQKNSLPRDTQQQFINFAIQLILASDETIYDVNTELGCLELYQFLKKQFEDLEEREKVLDDLLIDYYFQQWYGEDSDEVHRWRNLVFFKTNNFDSSESEEEEEEKPLIKHKKHLGNTSHENKDTLKKEKEAEGSDTDEEDIDEETRLLLKAIEALKDPCPLVSQFRSRIEAIQEQSFKSTPLNTSLSKDLLEDALAQGTFEQKMLKLSVLLEYDTLIQDCDFLPYLTSLIEETLPTLLTEKDPTYHRLAARLIQRLNTNKLFLSPPHLRVAQRLLRCHTPEPFNRLLPILKQQGCTFETLRPTFEKAYQALDNDNVHEFNKARHVLTCFAKHYPVNTVAHLIAHDKPSTASLIAHPDFPKFVGGTTLLHLAVHHNKETWIAAITKANSLSFRVHDQEQLNPLGYAIKHKNWKMAEYLIQQGASFNSSAYLSLLKYIRTPEDAGTLIKRVLRPVVESARSTSRKTEITFQEIVLRYFKTDNKNALYWAIKMNNPFMFPCLLAFQPPPYSFKLSDFFTKGPSMPLGIPSKHFSTYAKDYLLYANSQYKEALKHFIQYVGHHYPHHLIEERPLLYWAIALQDEELIRFLINKGAKLYTGKHDAISASLIAAAQCCDYETLLALYKTLPWNICHHYPIETLIHLSQSHNPNVKPKFTLTRMLATVAGAGLGLIYMPFILLGVILTLFIKMTKGERVTKKLGYFKGKSILSALFFILITPLFPLYLIFSAPYRGAQLGAYYGLTDVLNPIAHTTFYQARSRFASIKIDISKGTSKPAKLKYPQLFMGLGIMCAIAGIFLVITLSVLLSIYLTSYTNLVTLLLSIGAFILPLSTQIVFYALAGLSHSYSKEIKHYLHPNDPKTTFTEINREALKQRAKATDQIINSWKSESQGAHHRSSQEEASYQKLFCTPNNAQQTDKNRTQTTASIFPAFETL